MTLRHLIGQALAAKTVRDIEQVEILITEAVGGRYERPLGDIWNNIGLIGGTGSFDHKILENVTNMQDTLLEKAALVKFGDLQSVPYRTPHEAAKALLSGRDYRSLADDAVIEFHESDPPTTRSKRITAVFRDRGCGIRPGAVSETIFALGSSHKESLYWLQGAFGVGAKTTFRNAKAVILVTRRAPELLEPNERDVISVAVLRWQQHGKGESAYYLVDRPWTPGAYAEPLSIPAAEYPEFDPGTHLSLISYGVEGFHYTRLGDEKSFDTVLNTRLFNPIMPVRFSNAIHRDRRDYLRGLKRRLVDNPRADRAQGEETLPYSVDGQTYHLPVSYWVFEKPRSTGGRDKFVAHDHCVVFTSNGQVHKHWTKRDFRLRTGLNKLQDRIFVVVDTDELPIEVRTSLFTADRSDMVRTEAAIRLEEQVAGFLKEWDQLRELNAQLIREAIQRGEDRPTINIARQISAMIKARGFSLDMPGQTGGGPARGGGGRKRMPLDLYADPTTLEGPIHAVAPTGEVKFVRFMLNAVNTFMPSRGNLKVTCDHPDVTAREITIGQLKDGWIRVSISIPEGVELGIFKLEASVEDWRRSSGGIGPPLVWVTKLEIVHEIAETSNGSGKSDGKRNSGQGNLVGLVWSTPEEEDHWDRATVGEVRMVRGSDLAQLPEYSELAGVDDEIQVIFLNREYSFLKSYIGARESELAGSADRKRDQYAVGVGVGLLLIDATESKAAKAGETVPDFVLEDARRASARSVLSNMPAADRLARLAGLEED